MTPPAFRRLFRRVCRPGAVLTFVGWLGGLGLAGPGEAGDTWFSFGVLGGTTRPDSDLSRYHWDVGGHVSYGFETLAGTGRYGAGLRLVRWGTTQGTGIPGGEASPSVSLTDLHLHMKAHALSISSLGVYGTAGVGRYHMAYRPDRLTLDPGGGLSPITVEFDEVTDWSFSLGLGMEHGLGRDFVLGAELERSLFLLDTYHRSGTEIVTSRDSFTNWNLRLRLSWMLRKA